MDKDVSVEPELDGFSRILPLPYRVAAVIVFGVWAWGLNLQYLSFVKIDVPALIRYPSRSSAHHPSHHFSTYRLAAFLTIPLILSLLIFWAVTHGSIELVKAWQILPQFYLFLLIVLFILPLKSISRSGRIRFLSTLKRISIGGIAEAQDGKFGDILLADALTSYAKVLGELFVAICMFVTGRVSSTGKPDRECGGAIAVPLIIAIPSLIRLRQCLIEYFRVRRSNIGASQSVRAANGWGGQHLANAAKYSTAFPVIILNAMSRSNNPETSGISDEALFRAWLFAVVLNSAYSFYWDVTKDWDLTLLTHARGDTFSHPYGLRRNRYFHDPMMYYVAIGVDLMLRCTWVVRLHSGLDTRVNGVEGGIFFMELLEVIRRWMWIFFRVETEQVRSNRGPAQDDILLGDFGFNNKIDDD